MRVCMAVLGLVGWVLTTLFANVALAQGPIISVGFRNESKSPVIIQGTSVVNGMVKRGQPVLVAPGRIGGDFNVPPGPRIYSVYDANQPSRVLLKDVPILVPQGRNLVYVLRVGPNNLPTLMADGAP